MMKRIFRSVLVFGVCLTSLTVPVMVQPSWVQSQNSQVEKLNQLIEQAKQQERQGQARQAIETWQEILAIARQFKEKKSEALALNYIGSNYNSISQPQEALKYYNQAFARAREIGDRTLEATILDKIKAVNNRE